MLERNARVRMEKLYTSSSSMKLKDEDRLVIFSDLHMGNGGRRDDFLHNGPLFETAIRSHYIPNDFDLLLNGDIEELHKFLIKSIKSSWWKVFDLFREMEDRGGFFKLQGNHDSEKWLLGSGYPVGTDPRNGLKLDYKGNRVFFLHGHQAGMRQDRLESLTHYLLKYGARPLAINNLSVSNNATRKYMIEKRAYNFAKERKIIAIIGHTHRPLFESQSKVDSLKFRIERMLRDYPSASNKDKKEIQRKISIYKKDLTKIMKLKRKEDFLESLYHDGPVVPCLFNSGCGVGKRGITALEIDQGRISLVYWFDRNRSQKYFNFNGYVPERIKGDIYKVTLKSAPLDYIFSRIRLLS